MSKPLDRKLPYMMEGVPAANSGAQVRSIRDAAQLIMNAPCGEEKARAAIERINRREGQPRLIEKVLHEHYEKNIGAVRLNARHIENQLRKAK